jgi:hypothetical protein
MSFQDHLHQAVTRALASIPAADAADIYALSFLIYDEDDDPQRPTLTIGYNTEGQVKRVLDNAAARHRHQTPDPAEVRWNYAHWLQNELAVIGDSIRDPEGATQRAEWVRTTPPFRDHPDQVTARFVRGCVRLVHSFHEVGLIERTVGRPVPVLIHELEYDDQIAEQTRAANPPGLADDFITWVYNQ